ncbi:MAG: hypothetical protein ABIK44_03500 [candidate division WOR-3 bacterium]
MVIGLRRAAACFKFILFGLVTACTSLFAEGGLPGAFLDYAPGPRSLGMGKAFAAVSNDAQAGYFNPAGLYQLNAQEVLLAHSQLYGARLEFITYALPTKQLGTFGLTILSYGAEGLDSRTRENWQFQPYWFMENAYIVSYAYNPWDFLGFGANLKLVTKNIAQFSGTGFGADLSAFLRLPKPLSFGITIQNLLQPVVLLQSIEEHYPRTLRAGAAVHLLDDRAVIALDVVNPILSDFDTVTGSPTGRFKLHPVFHGGVEFELVPKVLVQRVGIDQNEISLGLGIHKFWGKMGMGVDYAVLLHHRSRYQLSPTHKLGLFFDFAGFRVWIDAQPRLFSPTPEDPKNVLWMDVRSFSRAPVKRWQLLIKNGFGEVVRSYSGWDEPPMRMTWDGLDDAGRLVSDGNYYYEILLIDQRNSTLSFSAFLTEIRTKGPQGRIEIRPGQ